MVVRWLLLLLVPVSILMVPVPSGLTPLAWKIFAVYIAAILGLILRPAGEAVVMLSVIAFGSFIVPVGQLLSGYGNGTVWLVFTAFLITQAFADTGLGRRVAYWMIGRFGKSSLGLVYGQMLTDLILSPATPSNTARSGGIVYPIFRNVASTLNSEPEDNPRRIGSYITISGYAISLSTSAVFLTACAPNILTVGFARDILKVDIRKLADERNHGNPIKVVANLPYYITTPIIMGLFENHVPLKSITIMVQKEVADRMQTGPGSKDYGALSLAVQYYAKPEIVANVPPNCFIPRPNVGSAVIRLTRYEEAPVFAEDEHHMFSLIRASFNQRRKTLVNGLTNGGVAQKEQVLWALSEMNLPATIRGEALTLSQFAALSNLLLSMAKEQQKIHS